MFEIQYLQNGWVKKDGVYANLVQYDCLTLDTPIDFAFSPRLNEKRYQTIPHWGIKVLFIESNLGLRGC